MRLFEMRVPYKQNGNMRLLARIMARTKFGEKIKMAKRAEVAGAAKRKRRTKWKTSCRRMTKKVQSSLTPQIPRASFQRLVREIFHEVVADNGMGSVSRMQRSALDALHVSAEEFVTELSASADKYANHAKRVTLVSADLQAAVGDVATLTVPPSVWTQASLARPE